MLDFQQLVFPKRFTSADARAWASLYGFEHDPPTKKDGCYVLLQRSIREFAPNTLRSRRLSDSVTAIMGEETTPRMSPTAYEIRSMQLRRRALRNVRPSATTNDDLALWYRRWFERTHPGYSRDEADVAAAIERRLRHLDRSHARAYVAKLRASPLGS